MRYFPDNSQRQSGIVQPAEQIRTRLFSLLVVGYSSDFVVFSQFSLRHHSLPYPSTFHRISRLAALGYGSLVDFCGSRILAAVCLCGNANAGMGDSACEPDSSLISTFRVSRLLRLKDDMKTRRYEGHAIVIPFEKIRDSHQRDWRGISERPF